MRFQVYKKEKMIQIATKLAIANGFSKLTARSVADVLNSSIQPIYKQFKNMDDLREHVLENLWYRTVDNCYVNIEKYKNDDIYIHFTVELIKYYIKNPSIYKCCWTDEKGKPDYIFSLSEFLYLDSLFNSIKFNRLTQIEKKDLHFKIILTIHGIVPICNLEGANFDDGQLEYWVRNMTANFFKKK